MIDDAITFPDLCDATAERPNILMIFSDQHTAAMTGYMGHPLVRTPNLDRLADNSAIFENAYCNSPLCSPSRQSFMAGQYCCDIGVWNNTAMMPEDTVTWAHMLSAGGYETSLIGKMHFNGYQKMYGFDRRPVLEGSNSGEHFYSWGVRSSVDWTEPLPYRSDGGRGMNNQLLESGPDDPERQPIFQKDFEVLQGTLDFLSEKSKDTSGQPWAACSAFVLPHPPYRARADVFATYEGQGDMPANAAGEGRDTCDRYIQQFNGNLQDMPEKAIRRTREAYFALITEFDEYVGRILDHLEATGLAENTVVVYFSDHGEMAGEHGLWGKVTLLETSVRVPMLIRWPGRTDGGSRITAPVSLVDLFPTFLDIAGVRLPEPLSTRGHSLLPLIDGRAGEFEGGEVFGEFEGEGWNHPRAFLRNERFKYVHNHTAEERLYDLQNDPLEMHDLSGDEQHAEVLQSLRQKMLEIWEPESIEQLVLQTQARGKIARCRNLCMDLGW